MRFRKYRKNIDEKECCSHCKVQRWLCKFCHFHRESIGHIPVYDNRVSNRKRKRKDKEYSRNEKRVHDTEVITQRQQKKEDLAEVSATSERGSKHYDANENHQGRREVSFLTFHTETFES